MAGTYYLGKNAFFSFSAGITNTGVKSVTINRETAAEADVTTRGDGDESAFAFVRRNTSIDVTCLFHSLTGVGASGTITVSGTVGSISGVFQVMSINETQDLDNAVEYQISLRKNPS